VAAVTDRHPELSVGGERLDRNPASGVEAATVLDGPTVASHRGTLAK
jgi:hypothetical protein